MYSLLNCLLDNLAQGILLVDKEYRVVLWNGWMERVSGLNKAEVIGKKVSVVCPCFVELKFRRMLMDTIVRGQNCFFAGILHHAFVSPKNVEISQQTKRQNMQIEAFYHQGETFALIQIYDITVQYRRVHCLQNMIKRLEMDVKAVKKAEERARQSALYDPLTGVCNRNSLFDRLEYVMNQAKRAGWLVAVLFIDLDGFKIINDRHGHITGDNLIKEVAVRLKQTVRQTDIVARFGGDEFVVILPNIYDPAEANYVGQKIRHSIDEKFNLDGKIVSITASIGISLYPSDADNVENLLKKADQAMYSVKAFGKNDCQFASTM